MVSLKDKIYILGISCFYHDSAVTLIRDGEIVAAVQEERFSRRKHDPRFPVNAIRYCLESQNIDLSIIKSIVYYEKPLLTFERLLETYLATAPRGLRSFIAAMQVWLKEKLFLKSELKKQFEGLQQELVPKVKPNIPELLFSEHHLSHAAAAFYPSPIKQSAILCMDGVGEWATTSAWIGSQNTIKPLWEISFPHSLGLLYSAFTYYCGFKVNSGEYKLMGLAPYGEAKYVDKIKNNLIDIKEDGTFKLDINYFKYHRGFRMTSRKFHNLFGNAPREKEKEITQFHMDLAASIQVVTEEIVLKLAKSLQEETGIKNLCLAGGVALNCVANGKLLKEEIFNDLWIQPASGDAGSSLGAALVAWHQHFDKPRRANPNDSMKGTYLGCEFSNHEIISYLKKINATFQTLEDDKLFEKVAQELEYGKVIGWFNGPMEFGPRALGGRSIIGDPRNKEMQRKLNLKIKYRESFRPFAPSILEEDVASQFEMNVKSPYMLLVAPIKKKLRKAMSSDEQKLFGIQKLNISRSSLPAITHVDYSARIQTVSSKTNPRYHKLITAFKERTGCPAIINTSFNVRGEPIVCTPQDAFRCFMRTEMDILILQNRILFKNDQLNEEKNENWMQQFALD
ncbi:MULTISPECIES: carbamoyltransferase [unclassified Prochlorococcus]|uniref:carbamoyltransferase family protein n=1 Tax=unclassified Prochlorococcus TaxID=2627481 RepID=UPI0005338EC1|nr:MULTISPECIES: carbamoyltransferase [unclassified Prochlorococcus]KGG14946.1 Carbamoyltransferase [Prochlorococcus sp. MIT 0602]KGG15620.1 Carbamoyltransferase [Prochlorococcus sp. MIT 0603]